MTTVPYLDEQDAAKHLLREATAALNLQNVEYAVVGGWSPFLFHSHTYGHPGTFDVDILLGSQSLDDGSFERVSEVLLSNEYMRAPKNLFQAHRVLNVRGEDLVYHVDFLNEREPTNEIEMVTGQGRMKSVYTPVMKAVFLYGGFRSHPDFPGARFPSVETFIATKAVATAVKKRQRDAFDIFVTVQDLDASVFASRWKDLCMADGLFLDANDTLYKAIENGDAVEKILAVLAQMDAAGQVKVPMPDEAEVRHAFEFLLP